MHQLGVILSLTLTSPSSPTGASGNSLLFSSMLDLLISQYPLTCRLLLPSSLVQSSQYWHHLDCLSGELTTATAESLPAPVQIPARPETFWTLPSFFAPILFTLNSSNHHQTNFSRTSTMLQQSTASFQRALHASISRNPLFLYSTKWRLLSSQHLNFDLQLHSPGTFHSDFFATASCPEFTGLTESLYSLPLIACPSSSPLLPLRPLPSTLTMSSPKFRFFSTPNCRIYTDAEHKRSSLLLSTSDEVIWAGGDSLSHFVHSTSL